MHPGEPAGPVIDTRRYDAVIFDMDGVVTDTAAVHAAAWTEIFDRFLGSRDPLPGENLTPFTAADYQDCVDGKPRYDGVADFLAARGISLPRGDSSDPPGTATVCGLGNAKDEMFRAHLAESGVRVFDGTVALVHRLRAAGVRTAVFSASRHAGQVLEAAGLGELFGVRVDGLVAERLGLPGKPDPATLLHAAAELDTEPERTVVVEDAEAGVTAGRSGGFGLVIGIDRTGRPERLSRAGADIVVADAANIRVRGGFRRLSEIADALVCWPSIADTIEDEHVAVLLDFDGTISDIVPDPGAAVPIAGVRRTLARLAAQCPVAVISGRGLDDLRTRVGVDGIWYAGSHGFELLAPDGTRHTHDAGPESEPALVRAAAELARRLGRIPGILIEPKAFAVAVHHRRVAVDAITTVVSTVHDIAREQGLRVTAGRKVTELRPDVDWDKGRALQWVLNMVGHHTVPVYLGDDLTDEDAFDAVEVTGIPIVVRHNDSGDRRTAARFALDRPARAGEFLVRLADLLAGESDWAAARSWVLGYEGYDPVAERLREALCAVGNGYLVTRAAAPESRAGEHHYPGTYVAGIYNRLTDEIDGHSLENESLVNLPNWLPLTWRIGDGEWFDIDAAELLDYTQEFDFRRAVLERRWRYRDAAGRVTAVVQRRFASMRSPHLCALRTIITPDDWDGPVTVRSRIDGSVRNAGVDRYARLSGQHLTQPRARTPDAHTALVVMRTSQSQVTVAVGTRTTVAAGAGEVAGSSTENGSGQVGHLFEVRAEPGRDIVIDKVAAVYTGRDRAISAPDEAALRLLGESGGFDALLAGHAAVWDHLWRRFRIDLDASVDVVRALRLHVLQLAQTLSIHTADLDAGVPARGLHGEAYRGHVFWDELFVLPVVNLRMPELSRELLRYRFRRLPAARAAARALGCRGALFPWQSGSDGREESQRLHLNPRSGRWNPDPSARAHHAGLAVAYNVWHYYQATRDGVFLAEYGAELLIEIARFWADRASYEPADDRYHIRGVIGPDEFHSGYPQAPYDGIDDNAYTNVMAVWTIRRALDAVALLAPRVRAELLDRLAISAAEPEQWAEVADRMIVPFHDGIISQFAGYDRLAELDWDDYRRRYGDIGRLDRLLEAEGDDVNRYRVAKQADVLMLFYLLSADELGELLARLGYDFGGPAIPRTVDYYLARTSHGSSLSAVVDSWVLARANRDRAMEFFGRVLESDIADIQGGTTAEGIHLGAMAGSVDLAQRCFTGLEIRENRIIFEPAWPSELGPLIVAVVYHGHRLTVRVDAEFVDITSDADGADPITIECRGRTVRLAPGDTTRLPARAGTPATT
ncbi:trehalose-phosphatase [Nocardia nova]|uniref:trehalose-phosphatase n=1 Tax=Nocardia nova TaxID=37330 RepID=UPI000570C140|nr:trehalose-phosphatase [Nocardia nova]